MPSLLILQAHVETDGCEPKLVLSTNVEAHERDAAFAAMCSAMAAALANWPADSVRDLRCDCRTSSSGCRASCRTPETGDEVSSQ